MLFAVMQFNRFIKHNKKR